MDGNDSIDQQLDDGFEEIGTEIGEELPSLPLVKYVDDVLGDDSEQ